MKFKAAILFLLLLASCVPRPRRLAKLPKHANLKSTAFPIVVSNGDHSLTAQYLGCGGLYFLREGSGIFIDPFFSNQRVGKLANSVMSKDGRRRSISSDRKMVEFGLKAVEKESGPIANQVDAIFTAHSHYDHLMDVPAVFSRLQKKPTVYVSESGYNICSNVIDKGNLKILEAHMTTRETTRPPIVIHSKNGKKINVYPILADHNPHFNNIKAFSGSTQRPVDYFKQPYDKTRANDWLEGATFSFLIDYLDSRDSIELRLFVQSSSCMPPAGIPPRAILKSRAVDVAFLGIASFGASPDYPDSLLKVITPAKVVWIHWEDFFRGYQKDPKTVRATNVREFFEKKIQAKQPFEYYTPWPRVAINIKY